MMTLDGLFKFGYAMVLGTIVLMIYASLASSAMLTEDTDTSQYPPCFFNPLCSCSKNDFSGLGHVVCENIPFSGMPHQLNQSRVYNLQLVNNGLRHIPPKFLDGTSLYRIQISKNNLTDVDPEAFEGLDRTLHELDLHSNRLIAVPSRSIRRLRKLALLNLTDNEITDLHYDNWKGVEKTLMTLILKNNGISNLSPGIFGSLEVLSTLDLSGNAILELNTEIFKNGPRSLNKLILQDNAIQYFPYEQISALRQLQYLDMSKNRISQLIYNGENGTPKHSRVSLNLGTLRLDYNQIRDLPPKAFENFHSINSTYLDGNPIESIQKEAFRGPRIKELYLRDCRLPVLSEHSFLGLEPYLTTLDLSANNLTTLPLTIFREFSHIKSLSLRENLIRGINPVEAFSGFQNSLTHLDMSGQENSMIAIDDLKRMRHLRHLSLSRLVSDQIRPEDFQDFKTDIRELKISNGGIRVIKKHAFKNVQTLEKLDLSDNSITTIEGDAFEGVGDSITYLNLANAFSDSVVKLPSESFRHLTAVQRLDISNNRLRNIPDTSFRYMDKLQTLHMEDNSIDSIVRGTFEGDVEKIFLNYNFLSQIGTHTFKDMDQLDTVQLDDNTISKIDPKAFSNLKKLKFLSLRGNKINQIQEEAFQNLPSLHDLDLSYNRLTNFDFDCLDQVGTMSSFRVNVSYNQIRLLDNNSSLFITDGHRGSPTPSNIKELDFSHNNITAIHRTFFKPVARSLTHLHLGYNSLQHISKDLLGDSSHIQWLDLSYNLIEEVDFDSFKGIRNIQVILLSHNRIGERDKIQGDILMGLPNLRVVDLSYNRIKVVPEHFFLDKSIEKVNLAGNMISVVPLMSFTREAANSLVDLDVSNNKISSLYSPDHFSWFKTLQRLDLSGNHLIQIQESAFINLPRLLELDLSDNINLSLDPKGLSFYGLHNNLEELFLRNVSMHMVPEFQFQNLKHLDISNNVITSLPAELPNNLTTLRTLHVSGNHLDSVPSHLSHYTHLRTLSLARNPINILLFPPGLRLRELDIRQLPLDALEESVLAKLPALRTLRISPSHAIRNFNMSFFLQHNYAIEELEIDVPINSPISSLEREMKDALPSKLHKIQVSGRGLKMLGSNFLMGVRNPNLELTLHNTSIDRLSSQMFERPDVIRTLVLDVRGNSLKSLNNPNTANHPGAARKIFLMDLKIAGNKLNCDCDLGWIEYWERKKRQYFCTEVKDSCRNSDDDLRVAHCDNKKQQSVLDVLKSDLECGWNSAEGLYSATTLIVSTLFTIFLTRSL